MRPCFGCRPGCICGGALCRLTGAWCSAGECCPTRRAVLCAMGCWSAALCTFFFVHAFHLLCIYYAIRRAFPLIFLAICSASVRVPVSFWRGTTIGGTQHCRIAMRCSRFKSFHLKRLRGRTCRLRATAMREASRLVVTKKEKGAYAPITLSVRRCVRRDRRGAVSCLRSK